MSSNKLPSQISNIDDDKIDNSQRNLRLQATSQGPSGFLPSQVDQSETGHAIKLDKLPLMLSPGIESIK